MTTISVIIAAPSYDDNLQILSSLNSIDYPKDKMEIILAIGRCPSAQRNRAAEIANGDILYFLDCNARLEINAFKNVTYIMDNDCLSFIH